MTSAIGRLVVDVLTNQSGGSVAYGDVVYVDTGHDTAFTTGTTSGYTGMVGVCIEPNGIANAASGRIQLAGRCAQVNLNASGTRGHFIKTHTVAKQATDAGASRVAGAFGQILVTGSTPPVELFGFPDGSTGAAGSPGTPALTLSTTNSAGVAVTLVATDATIAAFDATAPVTQAFGDSAATGSAGTAARRDHKHGMPASPAASAHAAIVQRASTDFAVGNNTLTAVQWDAEVLDTDTMHDNSTNPSRVTIPTISGVTTGLWRLVAHGYTDATNRSDVEFRKNAAGSNSGGTFINRVLGPAINGVPIFMVSVSCVLSGGDYVECFIKTVSNSGNVKYDANSVPTFEVIFLGKVT